MSKREEKSEEDNRRVDKNKDKKKEKNLRKRHLMTIDIKNDVTVLVTWFFEIILLSVL